MHETGPWSKKGWALLLNRNDMQVNAVTKQILWMAAMPK